MHSTSTNFKGKYITWECTTECNYSCSYCWPRCHDGKYRWPSTENTDKLISYIKNFAKDKTVILDIMGGEPTLWPDLQRFCHSVGHYSLITFSSNGSRTARWWRNFTAPINHLLFSFHPENADVDHYVEMLHEVHTRYRTTIYILYHPLYKEKCMSVWNRLTQGDLEVRVKMKKINPVNYKIDYTDEDIHILSQSYFNSCVKLECLDMEMFIDDNKVDPDNLIATNSHKFTGWQCQLGQDYRYIKANGTVYGAACEVATPLGNVYVDEELYLPACVYCTADLCNCKVDLVLNTKYTGMR